MYTFIVWKESITQWFSIVCLSQELYTSLPERVSLWEWAIVCNRVTKAFFVFIFCCTAQHVGSYFPNQGLNLQPLCWKHGVLTTGLPGKSPLCDTLECTRLVWFLLLSFTPLVSCCGFPHMYAHTWLNQGRSWWLIFGQRLSLAQTSTDFVELKQSPRWLAVKMYPRLECRRKMREVRIGLKFLNWEGFCQYLRSKDLKLNLEAIPTKGDQTRGHLQDRCALLVPVSVLGNAAHVK